MKTFVLKNKKSGNFLSLQFDTLLSAINWANKANKRSGLEVTIWRKETNWDMEKPLLSQVVYK